MMNELIYLIMFDGWDKPEKIIAKDYLELEDIIKRIVLRVSKPYEWIIRKY